MIGEPSFLVNARFEDGKASLRITAVTPYGDRSASTTVDVLDPEVLGKLTKLFEAVIKTEQENVKRHSFNDAARAMVAAIDRGENVTQQDPHVRVPDYDDLQQEREKTAKRVNAEQGAAKKPKEK